MPRGDNEVFISWGGGRGEGAGGWVLLEAAEKGVAVLRSPGEGGTRGQQGNLARRWYEKRAWVTVSFLQRRSRAMGRRGEGAGRAIMGVVGPGSEQVWLLVKGRSCNRRLISTRFLKGEAV